MTPRQVTLLRHVLAGLLMVATLENISAQAYLITVDAGQINVCFHERISTQTKLGLSFEVVEGGFYDIDVEVKDPAGAIVHREAAASSGKVTIDAKLEGPYEFCFSNKRVSSAPKSIIFDIDPAAPAASGRATQSANQDGGLVTPSATTDANGAEMEGTDLLAEMVDKLMLATIGARHDVRYLAARDRLHRKVNNRTNDVIVWWSGVEFILLVAVTVGQVIFLKRFFEMRRKT